MTNEIPHTDELNVTFMLTKIVIVLVRIWLYTSWFYVNTQ